MKWQEIGCLLKVENLDTHAISHAMIPTPLVLNKDVLRIFFSSRDSKGIGRTRYADFDMNSNFSLIKQSTSFILDIGQPGTFDDNGSLVCSVIKMPNNSFFLYYAGFELSTKIRYRIFTGLAISLDGGESFNRHMEVPILDRTNTELFFRGGPYVQPCKSGYEMYYVGGSDWIRLENSIKPIYSIKKTFSVDGLHWDTPTEILKPNGQSEHGFGRPYEFNWQNRKFLYYSVRDSLHETYKLGYAEILNNVYSRKDAQFELYSNGKLVENRDLMYSSFVSTKESMYMLFNKREFGLEGIYLAKLIDLD
jgi:hypothetical protein